MHWYIKVLKDYAEFEGRARRKEYWMFTLINSLIGIAFGLVTVISGNAGGEAAINIFMILYIIYTFAVFVPSLAVSVRRLHDTGRTGWWLLIGLIPFIGPIIILVFMVLDSNQDENQYGANPKAATV
ncbi:MAG TPA: DUF805 domain-containing protein [Balneolaceae bacterium]